MVIEENVARHHLWEVKEYCKDHIKQSCKHCVFSVGKSVRKSKCEIYGYPETWTTEKEE